MIFHVISLIGILKVFLEGTLKNLVDKWNESALCSSRFYIQREHRLKIIKRPENSIKVMWDVLLLYRDPFMLHSTRHQADRNINQGKLNLCEFS